MGMMITHADENREELRFIDIIDKADMQISIAPDAVLAENTFSITVPDAVWAENPIQEGHLIYIDGTEWGGVVERIAHSTQDAAITIEGATWRGMLMRKVIEPPEGEGYLEGTLEANDLLALVIGTIFGDLVEVSTDDTGVNIAYKYRYAALGPALEADFEENGLSIGLTYSASDAALLVYARTVTDSSPTIDLSQDYDIDMQSEQGAVAGYNHVVALGAGELANRDVLHVYRLDDGTTTQTPPSWAGTAYDKMIVYDYTNPESTESLLKGAEDKLKDYAPQNGVSMDPSGAGLDIPLGDIVGARDRLLGFTASARALEKILKIKKGITTIETKVG